MDVTDPPPDPLDRAVRRAIVVSARRLLDTVASLAGADLGALDR